MAGVADLLVASVHAGAARPRVSEPVSRLREPAGTSCAATVRLGCRCWPGPYARAAGAHKAHAAWSVAGVVSPLPVREARSGIATDVARVLRAWKEGGAWRMTRAAATIVAGVVAPPQVDVLTSVPPERDRLLWRGHDPAAALARALAREWDLPCRRLLRRSAGSVAQKRLDASERRANAAGLFSVAGRVPPLIALVDDVYTTGATASAAASALREAGAVRVEVVTLARTLRHAGPTAARDRTAERLR